MLAIRQNWATLPLVVKKAIICLLAGWVAHYIFYFGFIAEDQRVTYLNLGVGIGICYGVATIRKWARMLCIYFNIIMVVMYTWSAIVFALGGKQALLILTALTAASFGFSLYYLLQKEASLFFSPPEKSKDEGADESPPAS